MDVSEFFNTPEGEARKAGRPRAVNPETGREQSWTSASNYAAELDSPFGLIRSNLRNLVTGLSLRHDLVRMLLSGAVQDDIVKRDEVIKAALATAEVDANANEGTAAHAVLVRSWLGQPVADEFKDLVAVFARKLREQSLTPVAAELKVMNLPFKSIGTFDWVFTEADGTHVIGDVKTGNLEHAKRKFAVQCAMYAGARYVVNADGTTDPMPWDLAQTHAVLVHVDLETLGVSIYRVDLHLGRYGAALAERQRAWHKTDPLSPYVPPLTDGPAVVREKIEAAAPVAVPDRDVRSMPHPDPVHDTLGPERPALHVVPDPAPEVVGEIEVTEPRPASAADAIAVMPEPEKPHPTDRYDVLMAKNDKAKLQGILRKDFGWTDLNHNRRWLARAIIALESGATGSAVSKYAAAKDDVDPVPEKPKAPSQETYDPAGLVLAAIGQMKTVEGIRQLHARRVAEHGDQGWTDAMNEAAKARVAELDKADGVGPSVGRVLELIAQASTLINIRDLWDQVTIGGTSVGRWTDEMQSAAEAKSAEIRAAQQPVASNPWG